MPPSRPSRASRGARRPAQPRRSDATPPDAPPAAGVQGFLGGLSGLLKTISELAERGEELQRQGSFTTPSGRDVNFTYGVKVRTLDDGRQLRVEPFGNLKQDRRTGQTVVHEVREPVTDVLDEDDRVEVLLEMPGIEKGDVRHELDGDILTVTATRGEKRYRKEVLLPGQADFNPDAVAVSCNNGVVTVRVPRIRR